MHLPRSVESADVSGLTVLVRADLNVPLEDGRDRRRHAHPRVAADPAAAARPRRGRGARLLAPRPAEVRRGPGARSTIEPVQAAAGRAAARRADRRCSRTPASTRARRRTTRATHASWPTGCDLYVDDAFGSAHRAHSSTEAVARLLPAYAGLLLLDELRHLGALLGEVERPFVIVSGGAKVDDKVGVLQNLGGRADEVLIGGKMAAGRPRREPVHVRRRPADRRRRRVGVRGGRRAPASTSSDALPDGWLGLDIGPRTREDFARRIATARDRVLERADGRLRVAGVRRRDVRGRPRGCRLRRLHRRRRRRLGARGARCGRGRADLVDLDRRRRGARAARGQGRSPASAIIPEA